mmetsp:Transcript_14363/g.15922  ORF Transcript_14363/g.15922 Transcript_14363/m.15922 type:complete len:249 (-) Transcript_14363:48-794(-)
MADTEVFQAAGHGSVVVGKKGTVLKEVQKQELEFYEKMTAGAYGLTDDEKKLFCGYFGKKERDGKEYIEIEDLRAGYAKACIMDIKMGTSSAGPDAKGDKRKRMEAKDAQTTTTSLGIRISGLRSYILDKDDYDSRDKPWGKKVTDKTMKESLTLFFNNGKTIRKDVIKMFLEQLKPVQEFFERQSKIKVFSSSILFVYDGASKDPVGRLRIIDMAHVFPITDKSKDEGYRVGMKNLIDVFTQIAESK